MPFVRQRYGEANIPVLRVQRDGIVRAFHAYLAGGPADDHENTRELDAVERARRGTRPMLRLGSAWYDVAAQVTAITERGLDPRQ